MRDIAIELGVQRFFALAAFFMGLSLLAFARQWRARLQELVDRPSPSLRYAPIPLLLGAFIIGFHNVWVAAIPVLVTIYGWLCLIKAVALLLLPDVTDRVARSWGVPLWRVMLNGLICVVLGIIVGVHAFWIVPNAG